MLLDGVQPVRDTFHSLIMGTMRGSRLQDAFFFRDEMKSMGLLPDVNFSYIIWIKFLDYELLNEMFHFLSRFLSTIS